MSETYLQEALNNCIDRLAGGQSLEECLRNYPDIADELRILLEIGQATSKSRADATELADMHSRLDAKVEALLADTDFDKPSPSRLPNGVTVLVASLLVVVIGLLFAYRGGENTQTASAETETAIALTQAPTATVTTPQPTPELTQQFVFTIQRAFELFREPFGDAQIIAAYREDNCWIVQYRQDDRGDATLICGEADGSVKLEPHRDSPEDVDDLDNITISAEMAVADIEGDIIALILAEAEDKYVWLITFADDTQLAFDSVSGEAISVDLIEEAVESDDE